jgi:hypothetical protein
MLSENLQGDWMLRTDKFAATETNQPKLQSIFLSLSLKVLSYTYTEQHHLCYLNIITTHLMMA